MLAVCGLCSAAQPPEIAKMRNQIVPKVRLADDAGFFAAWNLEHPGMEAVKAAVAKGHYAQAKMALKKYFLQRREPKWKVNYWEMPARPQGDARKHSYYAECQKILAHNVSVGGYDRDFGPKIDWNYFPMTGIGGTRDTEYPVTHYWNRFSFVESRLGPIYWFSHDERYAKEFVDLVTDQVQSYPAPETFTNDSPGPWRRLTSAGSALSLISGFNYFLPSESFTPEACAIVLKAIIEKARFAVRNPDGVNRYMAQLETIYKVGGYFPELKQAEGFRNFAVAAMKAAVADEFYPDCISKELCPGYHGGSRGHVMEMISAARSFGYETPPELLSGLRLTYDFYPKVATPIGSLPDFGDTWGGGGSGSVGATFKSMKVPIDDPVYRWFATDGKEGHAPPFLSTRLPWAGFYVMRSGWDKNALYLCMDAGPMGKDHWHEDYGNFECYAFGERLISEVGVYSYTYSKWNQYFRSSLAHNVVIMDGYSQKRGGKGPFQTDKPRENDWHSDAVFDLAWGFYDGKWSDFMDYRGKRTVDLAATHRRDICFVKNSYWVISDRLIAPGKHAYSQLFHFRPDRTVKVFDDSRAGPVDANRPNIAIIQADPVPAQIIKGREDPPQGWFSSGQGKYEPAAMLSLDQTATGGAIYDTIMLPLDKGQPMNVEVKRIPVTDAAGKSVPPAEVCALRLITPLGTDLYLNDLRQQEIGPANGRAKIAGELQTDARAAVVRLSPDGKVIAASAVGATHVNLGGRQVWPR
jgi:hypothetical protein